MVNKTSLLSTCTESQKVVYPLIDAIGTPNNKITKIEMYGERMKIDFDLESAERVIIDLEKSADFYVNSDLNDFKEFFVRPLIIE